jgi:toxin-antitoxin system PIN domain toxin
MPAMLIPDVNILVNAYRPDSLQHELCRSWLVRSISGKQPVGLLDIVCSGFVRICTNRRIFVEPASCADALAFVEVLWRSQATENIGTGPHWWACFATICRQTKAQGNLITDAHIAAVAAAANATVVTLDRDYQKFSDVQSRMPD